MSILTFKYDLGRDIEHNMNTAYKFKYSNRGNKSREWQVCSHLEPEFVKRLKKMNENDARQTLSLFLTEQYKNNQDVMDSIIDSMTQIWQKREKDSIERFEKFFGRSFIWKNITVYLITTRICPYNFEEKWFMINWLAGLPSILRTIYHELMHFMFLEYSKKILEENKCTPKEIDFLKEAYSIFVNTEFKGLNLEYDYGHLEQKDMRRWLLDNKDKYNTHQDLLLASAKKIKELNI